MKFIFLLLIATTATAQPLRNLADTATVAGVQYAILMQPTDPQPKPRSLCLFKTKSQARTWSTAIGYAFIAAGGYLGGKAEMKSRYYGTTRNWDSYHITRDAGIAATCLGSASLGISFAIGEKPSWREAIWKLASGAALYRITAEATYHAYAPNR